MTAYSHLRIMGANYGHHPCAGTLEIDLSSRNMFLAQKELIVPVVYICLRALSTASLYTTSAREADSCQNQWEIPRKSRIPRHPSGIYDGRPDEGCDGHSATS